MLQNTPVGTTVYRTLTANDKDLGRNGEIDFRIVPGDGGSVSATNCAITIKLIVQYLQDIYC